MNRGSPPARPSRRGVTGCVLGAYPVLVAMLDRGLRGAGAPVLATLLIALAFDPVRVRLQRLVDRWLYGSRADPVRAISQVGQRLAGDDLGGVVDGIRQTLRLPYAAPRSGAGEIAASGARATPARCLPLTWRGERAGELVVGMRRGERRLSGPDVTVLRLLAVPLAVAVHASGCPPSCRRPGSG